MNYTIATWFVGVACGILVGHGLAAWNLRRGKFIIKISDVYYFAKKNTDTTLQLTHELVDIYTKILPKYEGRHKQ